MSIIQQKKSSPPSNLSEVRKEGILFYCEITSFNEEPEYPKWAEILLSQCHNFISKAEIPRLAFFGLPAPRKFGCFISYKNKKTAKISSVDSFNLNGNYANEISFFFIKFQKFKRSLFQQWPQHRNYQTGSLDMQALDNLENSKVDPSILAKRSALVQLEDKRKRKKMHVAEPNTLEEQKKQQTISFCDPLRQEIQEKVTFSNNNVHPKVLMKEQNLLLEEKENEECEMVQISQDLDSRKKMEEELEFYKEAYKHQAIALQQLVLEQARQKVQNENIFVSKCEFQQNKIHISFEIPQILVSDREIERKDFSQERNRDSENQRGKVKQEESETFLGETLQKEISSSRVHNLERENQILKQTLASLEEQLNPLFVFVHMSVYKSLKILFICI